MGWGMKSPIYPPNYIVQASELSVSNVLNISDLSTTLSISISIFTVGGFRCVSFENFHDYFPPRNIDFQINLVQGAQSIFNTPII